VVRSPFTRGVAVNGISRAKIRGPAPPSAARIRRNCGTAAAEDALTPVVFDHHRAADHAVIQHIGEQRPLRASDGDGRGDADAGQHAVGNGDQGEGQIEQRQRAQQAGPEPGQRSGVAMMLRAELRHRLPVDAGDDPRHQRRTPGAQAAPEPPRHHADERHRHQQQRHQSQIGRHQHGDGRETGRGRQPSPKPRRAQAFDQQQDDQIDQRGRGPGRRRGGAGHMRQRHIRQQRTPPQRSRPTLRAGCRHAVLCCSTCADSARNDPKMRRLSSLSERSWKP